MRYDNISTETIIPYTPSPHQTSIDIHFDIRLRHIYFDIAYMSSDSIVSIVYKKIDSSLFYMILCIINNMAGRLINGVKYVAVFRWK